MKEIIILSCTNRPDSYTFRVANAYLQLLKTMQVEAKLLDFRDLPENIASTKMYGTKGAAFMPLVQEFIQPINKFIFVAPEYNGSYPGILKVFLDVIPPKEWNNKHACLVGVSTGRAGNLRGMDHLTGVLNYLKMHVYHNKLPISVVDKVVNQHGEFLTEEQLKASKLQLEGFLTL